MANLPLETMDMLGEKFFAFWLGVLIKGRAQARTQRNLKKSQNDDGELVERRNKNESADQERHGKWGSNTGEMRETYDMGTWGHEAGVHSSREL